MNFMERRKTVARNVGLMVMVAVGLSACGDHWKEEVLLHDGSKIVVERTVDRGGRHEIGQRPPIKEQSLSFVMPDSGERVKWEDNYSEDVRAAGYLPMQLKLVEGTAYLVAYPTDPSNTQNFNLIDHLVRHQAGGIDGIADGGDGMLDRFTADLGKLVQAASGTPPDTLLSQSLIALAMEKYYRETSASDKRELFTTTTGGVQFDT